jgi:hypothetical protein
MRWLLRNVIRDLKFESRRRRNPGKISRRPMIGGKPLPPNGTRFLRLDDFNPKLLEEIEQHQEWGNVQLLKVGRDGGEQDIDELRAMLGFKVVPKEILPAPKKVDSVPIEEQEAKPELEPGMKVDGTPLEEELPGDGELDIEEEKFTEEPKPLDPDELLDEEPNYEGAGETMYTESELMGLKKDDLILVHQQVVGKASTGKTKQDLTDEILAAQASD